MWCPRTWARGLREPAAAREVFLLVLLLVAATLLLTHPLSRSLGSGLPGNLGDPLLNAWTLGWGAQWLGGSGRPVWDAPIFHPYEDTLAYSEHLLGITVFVAPVYWLTGNPILTYNVALLGSFVLAGVGMYLLIKAITGRRDVAVLIALAFAFSPIRLGAQIARLQMLMTGWLPLALWALHRYAATLQRRYLVWLGASSVLLVLSNMYMLVIGALPIGLAILFEVVRAGERRARLVRGLAVTFLFVGLALAPFVLKYRGVQASMGFVWDEEEVARYSATLRSFVSAHESVQWLPWMYPEKTADRSWYVGGPVLLLAAAGIAMGLSRVWRARRTRGGAASAADAVVEAAPHASRSILALYGVMTCAAIVLSLGPELRGWHGQPIGTGPYEWLQDLLPVLNGLRAPGRFGMVAAIGLSVLAAAGAARLLARATPRRRALTLAAALALVLAEAWPVRFTVEPFGASGRVEDEPLYTWLRTQPPSALVELPGSTRLASAPNVILIYQFETLTHPHELVNGSSGFASPVADLLEGEGSPFRDPARIPVGVGMLRMLHVRYVVVHTQDYADPELASSVIAALRRAHGVKEHRQFGPNHVFVLEPGQRLFSS